MNYQIRLASREDTAGMLQIYTPIIHHTATSFEYDIPTVPAFWLRIQQVLKEAPWLICEDGSQVLGYAYASSHRSRAAYQWNRELSVYVHSDHRRQGIASALYQSLITLLRFQGFVNALIGITLPNPASVRFHEQLGFELIGTYNDVGFKHGKFHSVGWWQMKISPKPPSTIRTLDALSRKEWTIAIEKGLNLIQQ